MLSEPEPGDPCVLPQLDPVGYPPRELYGPGGQMVMTNPDRFLKKLSEHTGGGYFVLSKATDLNSTFSRIADELHRQYILAFSPPALDGKVHELDVRVKVPGMTARARRSYLAAAPK